MCRVAHLSTCSVKGLQTILSNIILKSIDKRVVHNATVLETVVRWLETVAALQRFRNRRQE